MKSYATIDDESYSAIRNAICHYVFKKHLYDYDSEVLKKLLNCISYNTFDDRELLDNIKIRGYIDFDKVNRKQLIRLMARDTSIINMIDFEKYNFSINELEVFLKLHPEYVDVLNIDFDNLQGKEILVLLKVDIKYLEKVNLTYSKFSRLEYMELIKHFNHSMSVFNKLDFEHLDNIMIKNILLASNDIFISRLKLNKLFVTDWLDILKKHPGLIKYCNMDLFIRGDCYYLAKLACVVPGLYSEIERNKNKISSMGWECLLVNDAEKYSKICNFNKLQEKNWTFILQHVPSLEKYKLKVNQ